MNTIDTNYTNFSDIEPDNGKETAIHRSIEIAISVLMDAETDTP